MATVEVKMRVSDNSLSTVTCDQTVIPDIEKWDSEYVNCKVPGDHFLQILHQCVVLQVNIGIYVCSSETGIVFIVVILFDEHIIGIAKNALGDIVTKCVRWAHSADWVIPDFSKEEQTEKFQTNKAFWVALNNHVTLNGPLAPVLDFRSGIQAFYSKLKCGVDGTTQFRAVLRAPTATLRWEQKMVTQTLKTLLTNGFICWRICTIYDISNSDDVFGSLLSFRNKLNHLEPFGDYVNHTCRELFTYADKLERIQTNLASNNIVTSTSSSNPTSSVLEDSEIARLRLLGSKQKKRRLRFFNGDDGKRLRLECGTHVPKSSPPPRWCALCGSFSKNGRNGSRSSYMCEVCSVHLCIGQSQGYPESCWTTWHTDQTIRLRNSAEGSSVPAASVQPDYSGETDED